MSAPTKGSVENVKELMTWSKHGAISVCQAIAKDGYQAADILAPIRSGLFMEKIESKMGTIAKAIPELRYAGVTGWLSIGMHGRAIWKDLKTEVALAESKMKQLGQI